MITAKIYIAFHNLTDDGSRYSALILRAESFFRFKKTPVNHCSIIVELPSGSLAYYHCTIGKRWKLADGGKYLRKHEPMVTMYIGEVTYMAEEFVGFIEADYHLEPWKVILYYLGLKFIMPWWKPKSCGSFASQFLQFAGVDVDIHVAPDDLLYALKGKYEEKEGKNWRDFMVKEFK